MKTETDNSSRSGGWVLIIASLAAAAALFVPLPNSATSPIGFAWFASDELSAVLALGFATAGFWAFQKRFLPRSQHGYRRVRSGAILVVLQAVLLRGALELQDPIHELGWNWLPLDAWLWTPWFLTTGLGVMLLGSRVGILVSLCGVLLLYLRADPGPLPLIGCLVSSLSGIILLRRSTRGRVLRAGLATGALLGTVAVIEWVQMGAPLLELAAAWAVPVVIALFSAVAVLTLLPLMEWILGELSDVTLVEYGSDHPLLDQLKERAPGTWHHTLNVADLAEKAAAAVGARALFCKTAVLYHDIGKLKDPSIFAENISGASPHDSMDPRASAERIVEHVSYGLELARKHRLPKPFRAIIAEHHGISVVRFFYAKACAQLREGEDCQSIRHRFAYSGPPPSSRESGIIALADVVEAATRSIGPQTETEARALVSKLISERIADGELAQCPLTLAELALAEETFVSWVKARNHQRPAYPKTSVLPAGTTSEWNAVSAAQPVVS